MAQLRFHGSQMLGAGLYRRRWAAQCRSSSLQSASQRLRCRARCVLVHPELPPRARTLRLLPCPARSEGTLAYFFGTQELRALAEGAGFEEVECEYACVQAS